MNSIIIHFMLLCLSMGYVLASDDANPYEEHETKLMGMILDSFLERQCHLLVNGIMKDDHVKELLLNHTMKQPDTDASFHKEFENILYLFMKWYYYLSMEKPSIIPHAKEFIHFELLKIERPQPAIRCQPSLLDDFIAFLVHEQSVNPDLTELIDFVRNNVYFRKQLKRALFARLEFFKLLEKKSTNEQYFYNDLFQGIDAGDEWYLNFLEKLVDSYSSVLEIIDRMESELGSFFMQLNTLE